MFEKLFWIVQYLVVGVILFALSMVLYSGSVTNTRVVVEAKRDTVVQSVTELTDTVEFVVAAIFGGLKE